MVIFTEALKNAVLITGLVMIMMLLIEYVNIHSHGNSFKKLKKSPVRQVLVATLLGMIPGCIGGFAVVSLFTHNLLSFGALVAMMIASSGDEAFVLMAMIPKTAVILFIILIVIAIVAGIIVDKIFKKVPTPFEPEHYELHENCCETKKSPVFGNGIKNNLRTMSKERLLIVIGISLFITAVVLGLLEHKHAEGDGHDHGIAKQATTTELVAHECTGCGNEECATEDSSTTNPQTSNNQNHAATTDNHDHTAADNHNHTATTDNHNHTAEDAHSAIDEHGHLNIFSERWLNLIFAFISLITLYLTLSANEHFIKEHLWNHVVKKHLKSIFLWTFGALLVLQFGIQYLDIEHWMRDNIVFMILLAVVIGLIPESGPHMVFITLFAGGLVPFSVLLASSIVQDGHTALPLLAESKSSFFKAKLINMLIGLIVGLAVYLIGF
ncbi:MAG: putative manganese transporter [Bacteroidales bacterium]